MEQCNTFQVVYLTLAGVLGLFILYLIAKHYYKEWKSHLESKIYYKVSDEYRSSFNCYVNNITKLYERVSELEKLNNKGKK